MKRKKPSMEELKRMIEEIHKDPELMDIAKKFVIRHGGRIPNYPRILFKRKVYIGTFVECCLWYQNG